MNHSQQENLRVKDQIVDGLFSLLKVKSFQVLKLRILSNQPRLLALVTIAILIR